MKKMFLLILALLTAVSFASCGKTEVASPTERTDGTTPENTTAVPSTTPENTTAAPSETEAPINEGPRVDEFPVADAPFDPADGMTENMLARSVHYEGDVTRLKAKLDQIIILING